jgi:hypothetical protein
LEIKGNSVLESEKAVYLKQCEEFTEYQIKQGLSKSSTRSKLVSSLETKFKSQVFKEYRPMMCLVRSHTNEGELEIKEEHLVITGAAEYGQDDECNI